MTRARTWPTATSASSGNVVTSSSSTGTGGRTRTGRSSACRRPRAPERSSRCPSLHPCSLVDDLSADQREERSGMPDLIGGMSEQVAVQYHKVRHVAGADDAGIVQVVDERRAGRV